LQPICHKLPSYLKSFYDLKMQLSSISLDAQRASIFTADAVSMYTNINTDHALSEISKFLRTHSVCADIHNIETIIPGLEIVMRNNLFKFGNTVWLQLTTIGTPCTRLYVRHAVFCYL
jgi:hypothetical protein